MLSGIHFGKNLKIIIFAKFWILWQHFGKLQSSGPKFSRNFPWNIDEISGAAKLITVSRKTGIQYTDRWMHLKKTCTAIWTCTELVNLCVLCSSPSKANRSHYRQLLANADASPAVTINECKAKAVSEDYSTTFMLVPGLVVYTKWERKPTKCGNINCFSWNCRSYIAREFTWTHNLKIVFTPPPHSKIPAIVTTGQKDESSH